MQKANTHYKKIYQTSNNEYYNIFVTFFVLLLISSNMGALKLCNIFGYALDGGTLIFPLLYITSDVVTEIYGFSASRRMIWLGVLYSIIFSLYVHILILLPSYDHQTGENFATVFYSTGRIIIASIASYLVGELINTFIIANLKIILQGKYFVIRAVFSTLIGATIESACFGIIVFIGEVNNKELFHMIILLTLIKVVYEIILMPITIKIIYLIKKREKVDVFEKPTLRALVPSWK